MINVTPTPSQMRDSNIICICINMYISYQKRAESQTVDPCQTECCPCALYTAPLGNTSHRLILALVRLSFPADSIFGVRQLFIKSYGNVEDNLYSSITGQEIQLNCRALYNVYAREVSFEHACRSTPQFAKVGIC